MIQNSYIARTVEGCSIGYAIVLRLIVSTTYYVFPLVCKSLICGVGMVGITEPIPIVIIMHTACCKLEVTTSELCAVIVILS